MVQYANRGNVKTATVKSQDQLEAGVYRVMNSMQGIYFEIQEFKTDKLLRFKDPIHEDVLSEIDEFWNDKEKMDELGFTHKRGILLYGPPGSGKTCITKLVVEDCIKKDNIIFICKDITTLTEGLKQFREVEPDRSCLVLMEDVDDIVCGYGSHQFLELLSGDSQVDNVLYLATTNYVNRLPERALRPDRFDRKIEVPFPPAAGRKAFLQSKLKLTEKGNQLDIDSLVKETKGFSYAHLKELLVTHLVQKKDLKKTIERLKGNGLESSKLKYNGLSESSFDNLIQGQELTESAKLVLEMNDLTEATDPIVITSNQVKAMVKGTFGDELGNPQPGPSRSIGDLRFPMKQGDGAIEVKVLFGKTKEDRIFRSFKIDKKGKIEDKGKETDSLKSLAKEIERLL